ncbi:MAG: hypothetical protein P1U80_03240 [Pseudomonadales bacterium]|nr:hypothetical protein [Pseudomonadales bacterium]
MEPANTDANNPDIKAAFRSEALYIITALIPPLGFPFLGWYYLRHRHDNNRLTQAHLKQTIIAGGLISFLFLFTNSLVIYFGGYRSISALIIFELYFFLVIPIFVIPGIVGVVKASSGEIFRFPLIARLANINNLNHDQNE